MNKNQSGFGVVVMIAAIAVVSLISFVGWYVWKNNSKSEQLDTLTSHEEHSEDAAVATDKKIPPATEFRLLSNKLTFINDGAWKTAEGGYADKASKYGSSGFRFSDNPEKDTVVDWLDEIMLIPSDEEFTNPDQFNVGIYVYPKNDKTIDDFIKESNGLFPNPATEINNSSVAGFQSSKHVETHYDNKRRLFQAIDLGDGNVMVVISYFFKGDHYSYMTDKDYLGYESRVDKLLATMVYDN